MEIEPERSLEKRDRLQPPSGVPEVDESFRERIPIPVGDEEGDDDDEDDDEENGEVLSGMKAQFKDGAWDRFALFDNYLSGKIIAFDLILNEASRRGLANADFAESINFQYDLNCYLGSEDILEDGVSESMINQIMDYLLQENGNGRDDMPTRNGGRSSQVLFNNYLTQMTFSANFWPVSDPEGVKDYVHSVLERGNKKVVIPASFKFDTEKYLAQTLDNNNIFARPTEYDAWADGVSIYVLPKRQDLASSRPPATSATAKKMPMP